jgi:hypothetical protein
MTHDPSPLLLSALVLAASAISAGCSSTPESVGAADSGTEGGASADGGSPGTDGAAPSCPAAYADITQGAACAGPLSCDYYGQFHCECAELTTPATAPQWQCIQSSCLCLPGDAGQGCYNVPCATDKDCPFGEHCGQDVGAVSATGRVCSVGCEGDAGPGGPSAACPSGATCTRLAP